MPDIILPGPAGRIEARYQRQKAPGAHDNGMGDMLRFDAERLRILVERHHLHNGSARARELLEDWDNALKSFIKVMPKDYKRAMLQARDRAAAKAVANFSIKRSLRQQDGVNLAAAQLFSDGNDLRIAQRRRASRGNDCRAWRRLA